MSFPDFLLYQNCDKYDAILVTLTWLALIGMQALQTWMQYHIVKYLIQ